MSTRATWQKLQIFKIQDGGQSPFWRSLNHHISVKNHPILIKFGTQKQILYQMTVTWPKIEICKIQDGGGRHLENRFFGHNSSTDCQISAKFCMRKQNGMSTRATWQKLQIFKIQDGGRPPFWKSYNRHYVSEKLSDFDEIMYVHYSKLWTRSQSRDQKLKFSKFKKAATAILKIAFVAITHRRFFGFGEILCEEAEWHADKGHMTKTANFKNPRWCTAAILKIVKSPYLSENIIGFWQYIEPDDVFKSAIAVS